MPELADCCCCFILVGHFLCLPQRRCLTFSLSSTFGSVGASLRQLPPLCKFGLSRPKQSEDVKKEEYCAARTFKTFQVFREKKRIRVTIYAAGGKAAL